MNTTIYRVERTRNSTYGNPRYFLHTRDGVLHTAPDVMWAYSLTNHTFPLDVTLTTNGWGKVTRCILANGKSV